MARLGNYSGKEDTTRYDCEGSRLSELRWESRLPIACYGSVKYRAQLEREEGSPGHDCSPREPFSTSFMDSIGSCYLNTTPPLSPGDQGTPQLSSESDASPSTPVDLLRDSSRSSRVTGAHDDDNDLHDSGEDISGANQQKSIPVSTLSSQPLHGESLTSRPIPSMSYVTKLTKRTSLTLSTNKLSEINGSPNSPSSIRIASPAPGSACKQSTLKRRGGINIFRRSAPMPEKDEPLLFGEPQVTSRPQSQPVSSSSSFPLCPSITQKRNSSSTSIPITSFQSHARSYSQPNTVRLGHPNRPYYSAIRKDMSPSPDATKLTYSRPASPPSSFPFPKNHARMSPQSLSGHDSEDLVSELSVSPFGYGSSGAGSEWSQSTIGKRKERHRSAPALSRKEEMELRLALARNVRGYTEDPDVGRQPGATDMLKRKMEKLRKGFKDMWRCWS
ncbi:hypothetical protein L218DRAFT_985532 [Marasmius fiardii PR-910]|nr:hypothetical protein L218DRAFT_985532 [Marasmius fiardii PR-910]